MAQALLFGSLLVPIMTGDIQASDGFSLPVSLTTAVAGSDVDIEVRFTGTTSQVAALAFVLDYDETRLALDPSSPTGHHKNVEVELPSEFASSIFFLSNSSGEVGLSIYDPTAPVANLPDGPLARFRFRVLDNASGFAAVRISDALSPNASDRFGNSVNNFIGTSAGGVMITALRPQLEPSDRALDFGTVPVDVEVDRPLILSNVGTASSLIE